MKDYYLNKAFEALGDKITSLEITISCKESEIEKLKKENEALKKENAQLKEFLTPKKRGSENE